MKKLLTAVGALVLILIVGLLVLRIAGFDPRDRGFPGLWLTGELVTTPVTDWSFSDQHETVFVQTRTWYFIPHSVITNCQTYNGQLYLTSTYSDGGKFPGRYWNRNIVRDPRVRLKIGNQLFDRRLELVTDHAEREAVIERKMKKYPRWKNPGFDKVYVFRVMSGAPAASSN